MKRIISALAATFVAVALFAVPSRADASWWNQKPQGPVDVSLVHGIAGDDGFPVDIYVVNNFRRYKIDNVTFGTAASINETLNPGFIKPGWVWVGILAGDAFENPGFDKPILSKAFWLSPGENKTVAAYVGADAAGNATGPNLGVFSNDVSGTAGDARATVRHLAVAPTVGVYANGAVPITEAFSNGETAAAVVPADTYNVTVTAPGDPTTVLFPVGDVALGPDTNTLAFAIGNFPDSFTVVPLVVPNN